MARPGYRRFSAIALLLLLVLAVVVVWTFVFVDARQVTALVDSATSSVTDGAESKGDDSEDSGGSSARNEGEWSMGDAREALSGDGSRVLVLGDSLSDGGAEWAHEWAESAGLEVASWRTGTESGYSGVSDGTRVWNGSMTEATAAYPLEHWGEIWPQQTPDLVLLSYGHFVDGPEGATDDMEQLRAKIAEEAPDAPIVVVLQNPEADDANQATREAIAAWAEEKRLPTINVARAFKQSDQPLVNLRFDEMNPSQAGTELWVETVADALGTS